MASKIEKTEGMVLRFYDYGDTSRIVVLLTRDFGKLKVMAKGLKGKRSPLAGRLELFYVCEILFYFNPKGDLHTLKEASIVKVFPSFHENLLSFAAASYLAELALVAIHSEQQENEFYQVLLEGFEAIGKGEDCDLVIRWVEIQVLKDLGIMPRMSHCVGCQSAISGALRLSPLHGGVLCQECAKQDFRSIPVSAVTTGAMQFFSQVPAEKAARVKLSAAQRVELKKVLRNFLDFTLERRLKSAEFLDQITAGSGIA